MPVSNWWTVIDGLMQITGGPFLWDGSADWAPPPGQRAVSVDPTSQGYSWPPAEVPAVPATLATLTQRVATLEARLAAEARGVKVWPAAGVLLLGATSTQRVTLKSAIPNGYVPSVLLTGGPLAGSFTVTAVPVDTRNVDVTIKAVVAATITANSLTALVFADTP